MMTFDIFNPQVSVVAKGLEGKIVLVYGDGSTGKTLQGTRMKKPFYLPFESGIRNIPNVPFLPINKWSDFKKINKQLCDPKTIEKAKETYNTIIFDEVFTASRYCQDFLCKKHGVETIGEGNNGYGLWKEYEMEFWNEFDKLSKAGYTIYFIGHEQFDKEKDKIMPKGDARSMQVVRDNADYVIYLTSNGVDEDGRVIKSSAWLAETSEFYARSRNEYIDTHIPEFTAETLNEAIRVAIERQEEAEGITAVSYDEQVSTMTSDELDFDKLKVDTSELLNELASNGEHDIDDLLELVAKHLGKDNKVSDTKPRQVESLAILYDELLEIKNN